MHQTDRHSFQSADFDMSRKLNFNGLEFSIDFSSTIFKTLSLSSSFNSIWNRTIGCISESLIAAPHICLALHVDQKHGFSIIFASHTTCFSIVVPVVFLRYVQRLRFKSLLDGALFFVLRFVDSVWIIPGAWDSIYAFLWFEYHILVYWMWYSFICKVEKKNGNVESIMV